MQHPGLTTHSNLSVGHHLFSNTHVPTTTIVFNSPPTHTRTRSSSQQHFILLSYQLYNISISYYLNYHYFLTFTTIVIILHNYHNGYYILILITIIVISVISTPLINYLVILINTIIVMIVLHTYLLSITW